MQVYIVFFNNFDGDDEFIVVYSSPEKAQEKIDRYDRYDKHSMRIEEMQMDEM